MLRHFRRFKRLAAVAIPAAPAPTIRTSQAVEDFASVALVLSALDVEMKLLKAKFQTALSKRPKEEFKLG